MPLRISNFYWPLVTPLLFQDRTNGKKIYIQTPAFQMKKV